MSVRATQKSVFRASDWLLYFKRNATQRLAVPWKCVISVEEELREPLIRSLQRFQVGEQGDGIHLRRAAARTRNADYQAAIELFVKEEQEHSRLLAALIEGMDGNLLRHHWSDTCFVLLRRFLGLRMELLVLLVAEIIAQVYYRVLYDGTSDPTLRSVCEQILYDEQAHVSFHCAYLRQNFARLPGAVRWLIYQSWRQLFKLVCFIVLYDHRTLLSALDVSMGVFWSDCMQAFEATRIFTQE